MSEHEKAPLDWLLDAEDDIENLARIVQWLAARAGSQDLAVAAADIAHKWEYRRNKR
jgi:hypothetical protein